MDDYRPCPPGFVPAATAEECKLLIDSEQIDVLSLDFDLGWGQPEGIEVVRHIVAVKRFPRRIYFHTSSPAGRQQMYALLTEHAPSDVQLFNGPMPDRLLRELARG